MFHPPSPVPEVPAHPPAEVPLGRRLLLGLVPVASLLLVAAACTGVRTTTTPAPGAGARVALGAGVRAQVTGDHVILGDDTFDILTQPLEITSRNGVLDVTLAAVWQNLFVPDTPQGSTMRLRTYQVVAINGVNYTGPQAYGFPAPTLRAYRGDSIHIVLLNQLAPAGSGTNDQCMSYLAADTQVAPPISSPPQDVMPNCFHGPNWTNIHYHGMHVTPDSVGDDVLLLIPPGGMHEYGFRIPYNQSPGTHWYHPHKHGSVAIQVMNGMTGSLIVDGGGLDSLADAHGMVEKVISLQQISPLPNLFDTVPTAVIGGGVNPPSTLINGKLAPVIVMRPGEVQRWRLVDENVTKTAAFRVGFLDAPGQEPTMYDVARDGVTYADTNYAPGGVMTPDTSVLMAPGNRLDVFVQAPQAGGMYQLQATPVAHDIPSDLTRKEGLADDQDPRTVLGRRVGAGLGATGTTGLFYVYVDASLPPNGSSLPTSLPPLPWFLANLPGTLDTAAIRMDSANLAVVVFAQAPSPASGTRQVATPTQFFLGTQLNPKMQLSDTIYTPRNSVNQPMPMVLDSVQTWKVVNNTGIPHPFHIHINPFQVLYVYYPNGAGDPNAGLFAQLNTAAQVHGSPIWLDVIPLPTNGYIYIRQGYEPFRNADGSICQNCGPPYGEFVMHCHILGHEERGMMQLIEIIPSASMQSSSAGGGHSHH